MTTEFPEHLQPTPAKGIRYFGIKEEGIVYDSIRNHIHVLNASARRIWQLCDGNHRISDIISVLGEEFGVPEHTLGPQISEAIRQFYQLYYLDDGDLDANLREAWGLKTIAETCIQFRDHHVCVHTDCEDILQAIQRKFACMISAHPTHEVGRLGVYDPGNGYSVSGTRMLHVKEGTLNEALKALKHEVVLHLMLATPDMVWLHAGAVSRGNGGVLLVGHWGAGKSTLVTELYHQGYHYLSDDMIPFDPVEGKMYAFPLTPAKRVPSDDSDQEIPVSEMYKVETPLKPDRIWATGEDVRAIILPEYKENGDHTLVPLSPGIKMLELIKQCQNLEYLKEDSIDRMMRYFEHCPAYRLQYADPTQAASEITTLM